MAMARNILVTASLAITLCACGGGGSNNGGGNGGGGFPPSGDGNGSAPELTGTWGGTIEVPGNRDDPQKITVTFDSNGDITSSIIGGQPGLTAQVDSNPTPITGGGEIYTFSPPSVSRFALITDDQTNPTHAALVTGGDEVAVLQKGTTSGSFAVDDAVGTWSGKGIFPGDGVGFNFDDPLATNPYSFNITYATSPPGSSVMSTNAQFTDSGGDTCTDPTIDLGIIDQSFGVYTKGSITGGSPTGSPCPTGKVAFQAFMSYDANFMVIGYDGGVPGQRCFVPRNGTVGDANGGCGLVVLDRQSPP